MIAVTIGVGPYYGEMARLAAERVRRFTGLPTRVLGDEEYRSEVDPRLAAAIGPMATCALKARLFELLPDFDDILYFDADLVFLAPWDPRSLGGSDRFVCVRDSWYLDFIQADAARLGVPAERYFNAGFFIASREAHAGVLAEVYRRFSEVHDKGHRLHDQSLFNLVVHERGVPVRFLDRRYNFVGWALDSEVARTLPTFAAHCVRQRIRSADKESTMAFLRGTMPMPAHALRAIDAAVAAELVARTARFGRVGEPGHPIALREDFTIGGWSADVAFWYPLVGPNGTTLALCSRDFIVCELARGVDGRWRGRFPRLHAPPGTPTSLAGAHWRPPGPLGRALRQARRSAQAVLRRPLSEALSGRKVELVPEG